MRGLAAQDGGAGIDGDPILNGRVALMIAQTLAGTGRQAAQGDALINLDPLADLGGLADDDAGSVVDEEVLADGGAGVDVNAGETVGVLGHDAGNEGHLQQVQLMCQAVDHDGVETGVGEDDLVGVERCRSPTKVASTSMAR